VSAESADGVSLTATIQPCLTPGTRGEHPRLCKGDVLTTCFKVRGEGAGLLATLGVLLVTWSRPGWVSQPPPAWRDLRLLPRPLNGRLVIVCVG